MDSLKLRGNRSTCQAQTQHSYKSNWTEPMSDTKDKWQDTRGPPQHVDHTSPGRISFLLSCEKCAGCWYAARQTSRCDIMLDSSGRLARVFVSAGVCSVETEAFRQDMEQFLRQTGGMPHWQTMCLDALPSCMVRSKKVCAVPGVF